MDFKRIFRISNSEINWKYWFSIGLALITPYIILISFNIIVGRLILHTDEGLFSNSNLYGDILAISNFIIFIPCLLLLLNTKRIPIIISITIAAILSKILNYIIGFQFVFLVLDILIFIVVIILFDYFIKRFRNPKIGLIVGYFISMITFKFFEGAIYAILFYRQWGKQAMTLTILNGEIQKKLLIVFSTGLLFTLHFSIGLLLSFRFLRPTNIKAL